MMNCWMKIVNWKTTKSNLYEALIEDVAIDIRHTFVYRIYTRSPPNVEVVDENS